MGLLQQTHLHTDIFQLLIPVAQSGAQFFRACVQLVQIVLCLVQDKGCGGIVLLCFLGSGGQLFQSVQPHSHLNTLELVLDIQVALCLFRLLLQGLKLQLQFRDLIADTQQIILSMRQLPLGFLLAVTVF